MYFLVFLLGCVFAQSVIDDDYKLTKLRDFSGITSMSQASSNELLLTEKDGSLLLFNTDTNSVREIHKFSVNTFGESGLLHTLVHNGDLYAFLVQPDTRSVIVKSRYDISNLSFQTIFRTDRRVECGNHKGGQMRIDNDGDLYVSIGDQCVTRYSQDKSEFYGKVLRMDTSGNPARFNPYLDEGGNARYVYARGLRNPFRMYYNSQTDKLYVNDVGQNTLETIYNVRKGDNYRWPNNGI